MFRRNQDLCWRSEGGFLTDEIHIFCVVLCFRSLKHVFPLIDWIIRNSNCVKPVWIAVLQTVLVTATNRGRCHSNVNKPPPPQKKTFPHKLTLSFPLQAPEQREQHPPQIWGVDLNVFLTSLKERLVWIIKNKSSPPPCSSPASVSSHADVTSL